MEDVFIFCLAGSGRLTEMHVILLPADPIRVPPRSKSEGVSRRAEPPLCRPL